MKRYLPIILPILFCLPFLLSAQQVTYSAYDREDNRDINFEIIGKMNDNKIGRASCRERVSLVV